MCRSGGKNKELRVEAIVTTYLSSLSELAAKVGQSITELPRVIQPGVDFLILEEIKQYHELLLRFINQIGRRLLEGEKIPQEEKIYSIFERHTEWIAKGKSRPNVELGHRLLVTTDQHGLIHDYKIMNGGSEPAEIPLLIERLKVKFSTKEGVNIASLSTDKGFSSRENMEMLETLVDQVIMPKKGKLTPAEKQKQSAKSWRKLAHAHSAIESDINCLEHHGLDRCPDKGFKNYERYVSLGVLSYNLHKIGNYLQGKVRVQKKALPA